MWNRVIKFINWSTCLFCLVILSACQKGGENIVGASPEKDHALIESLVKSSGRSGLQQFKDTSELALLLQRREDHPQAKREFEKSFRLSEGLYTRSLAQLALSKVVNERVKTFRGHYLERWMVVLMAAFNHLSLGDSTAYLVELRRLSRDIRLSSDPHDEKRLEAARREFLIVTGTLFALSGRLDEAFPDLWTAWSMSPEHFPASLRGSFLKWAKSKGKSALPDAGKVEKELVTGGDSVELRVRFIGEQPVKEERRVSVTMVNYWPVVHDMMGQSDPSRDMVQKIFLGALGKRLITVSYPVYRHYGPSRYEGFGLDFGELLVKSWDLQKKRLIAQSLVRIAFKMAATVKVSDAIDTQANLGGWGKLLGNVASALIWESERADLRQLRFLPRAISLDWSRSEGPRRLVFKSTR